MTFIVLTLIEELNLPKLFERLLAVEEELGFPCELLVIDDASEDGTLKIDQKGAALHP